MSYNNLPVFFSSQIRCNKLYKVNYESIPIVLLKTKNGIYAYEDYCPHRGLALSEGKIINDSIECKYHGWTFESSTGNNTMVPVKNKAIKCKLNTIHTKEKYGIVWLFKENESLPSLLEQKPTIELRGEIHGNILNTLENFLEGSHTHFVHNGLIRTKNKLRNEIKAKLTQLENGFKVEYESEPSKGFLTKLLPKKYQNLHAVSTYIHPGIAILEYFNKNNNLVSRFEVLLTEQNENHLNYFSRIFINIGWITFVIKPFAKLIFKKIIQQDISIIQLQQKNLNAFKQNSFISDNTDCVGIYLNAWKNKNMDKKEQEKSFIVHW